MNKENSKVIRLVCAKPLTEDKAVLIASKFSKKFDIKEYELKQEVDPGLLAGFVVYLCGYRYDYSAKGHIENLGSMIKNDANISYDIKKDMDEYLSTAKAYENMDFDDLPDIEPQKVRDESLNFSLVMDQLHNDLQYLTQDALVDELGQVISVSDGIAYVSGLDHCVNNELLIFGPNTFGIAMNLEPDRIGVILLGNADDVSQGKFCTRTGKTISVPTGSALLGRVVDAMGRPIDGKGKITNSIFRPIEFDAAGVVDRQSVNQPLYTGISAIDAMTPIGRGQRELIIGDRQTGKTAIAVDTIINQKNQNMACIYVAIGQKMSTVASVVKSLEKRGAMDYTTIVVASASDTAALQYIAPFAACAMAEQLMYIEQKDVLIVYDDLTKHAQAYRAISLLLRRPPGREAFPGDIFYLHSRLLERSLRLSPELGGHSITALPIVETQAGDISAYVPTNVISITDGQIYLETELFFSGQRPAINVGLSVSRVGGAAQEKIMKKISGSLRMNLAQYRELQAFAQFGSDLDQATQDVLRRGSRLSEVLKQAQYSPRSMPIQVILLYLASNNYFDDLETYDVHHFCEVYQSYLENLHPQIMRHIEREGELTEAIIEEIVNSFKVCHEQWKQELNNGATF